MLTGNVFITGGAGFLGRGIMRRAREENWPCKFTVYSRNELNQVNCAHKFPTARYVLGDVEDSVRLSLSMVGHDTVIHAAALKFIPEGEFNASEVVRVNIDGTRSVISAARIAGVRRVVGISTDKAAQPVNIYGMSKAVMERLFAETSTDYGTIYTTCRYGNVIGSTGSVVPVMIEQFRTEGQVKITDPSMTRFWMSVDDAVSTILEALEAGPGVTVVPYPTASNMWSVATAVLAHLKQADTREKILVIGPRPGEKQHEDLITSYERMRTVQSGSFFHILPPGNEGSAELEGVSSKDAEHTPPGVLAAWISQSVGL